MKKQQNCKELRFIDKRYKTAKVIKGIVVKEDEETFVFKSGNGREYPIFKKLDTYTLTETNIPFREGSK